MLLRADDIQQLPSLIASRGRMAPATVYAYLLPREQFHLTSECRSGVDLPVHPP